MSHKYKIRQMVKLRRPGFSDGRTDSGNTYEVIRLMPPDQTIHNKLRPTAADAPRVRNSLFAVEAIIIFCLRSKLKNETAAQPANG